ncbi:MAG TPA: hypothetical protein VE175_13125, partial [Woeseiaceae bacterium]|nr:hypothetical protein [Woeseiaceae bacterium]
MSAPFGIENHNRKPAAIDVRGPATRRGALVLPALAALGLSGHATALELGPVRLQSRLGEPLRASIAFALGPQEEIGADCIQVAPRRTAAGFPSAGPASVALMSSSIHLTGRMPVEEPLLGLQLTVDCPRAAHLSREYVVFVSPDRPAEPEAPARSEAAVREAPARSEAAVREAPARSEAAVPARPGARPGTQARRPDIPASTRYSVERGDTLSGIAARLTDRRLRLWRTVELLFAANPEAFIGNDPDRLRAGATLRIPDAVYKAGGRDHTARQSVAGGASASQPLIPTAHASHDDPAPGTTAAPADSPSPGRMPAATAAPGAMPSDSAARATPAAQPAEDGALDKEGLFVSPGAEFSGAPAEAGASPTATAADAQAEASPTGTPAADPESTGSEGGPALAARGSGSGAWSWLLWLGGSGVALILGLLLFGRRLRRRG